MSMSRADLMRVQVMGVALAAAARDLLEGEAREEWEGPNRTRVTWNSPGFVAAASITNQTLEVIDDQEFLAWVSERHPSEVIMVRRARNTEWLKQLRDQLATEVAAGREDAPPGTKLYDGEEFKTLAITPDRELKRAMFEAARMAIMQGVWPDAPSMWDAVQALMKGEETPDSTG
jgi:hypothetical protein